MNLRLLIVLTVLVAGTLCQAETFEPEQMIYVSDNSDQDFLADDIDPGPLDEIGDIIVRERQNITQDNLQIRTFVQFDVSSLDAASVAGDAFSANLSIDFVTRLNTVNNMGVLVGRVLDDGVDGDEWGVEEGELPLFEWARVDGEPEILAADSVLLIDNIKDAALGTYQADVTPIVRSWVTGESDNNGFVLFGTGDVFQGAGLENVLLTTGLLGDFDDNGVINAADFTILSNNLAAHLDGPVLPGDGDLDLDGDVDLDDFGRFKEIFPEAAGIQAVPEPEAIGLVFPALLGLLAFNRAPSSC